MATGTTHAYCEQLCLDKQRIIGREADIATKHKHADSKELIVLLTISWQTDSGISNYQKINQTRIIIRCREPQYKDWGTNGSNITKDQFTNNHKHSLIITALLFSSLAQKKKKKNLLFNATLNTYSLTLYHLIKTAMNISVSIRQPML